MLEVRVEILAVNVLHRPRRRHDGLASLCVSRRWGLRLVSASAPSALRMPGPVRTSAAPDLYWPARQRRRRRQRGARSRRHAPEGGFSIAIGNGRPALSREPQVRPARATSHPRWYDGGTAPGGGPRIADHGMTPVWREYLRAEAAWARVDKVGMGNVVTPIRPLLPDVVDPGSAPVTAAPCISGPRHGRLGRLARLAATGRAQTDWHCCQRPQGLHAVRSCAHLGGGAASTPKPSRWPALSRKRDRVIAPAIAAGVSEARHIPAVQGSVLAFRRESMAGQPGRAFAVEESPSPQCGHLSVPGRETSRAGAGKRGTASFMLGRSLLRTMEASQPGLRIGHGRCIASSGEPPPRRRARCPSKHLEISTAGFPSTRR